MLSFCWNVGNDSRLSRREFLHVGGACVGGLALDSIGGNRADASTLRSAVRGRSVVLLNLQGGPSQYETFDPNMHAPQEIRSITGEVATSLPGITFGGTLPKLARLADQMAVVRSYCHGISDHGTAAMHVMAGGNPSKANMSSLFSRIVGLTDARTGLPQSTLVTPGAVGDEYKSLYKNVPRVTQTGTLSPIYKPFDPGAGGQVVQNMRLSFQHGRLADRKVLLRQLDQLRRRADREERFRSATNFQRQAFDVLLRSVADAFDLSQEDQRTIDRFDTAAFASTEAVIRRSEYAKQFSPIALGKQLLLARRLCEAGCGFVTVTCGGWDMHGGGKEFSMYDGIGTLTPALDHAVSAFIEDVRQRGLRDRILLVITGEFGRTPQINKNGGRDHWGNLCPLVFVGGGLKMGQIVGRSNRKGAEPASTPISSQQVLSTIMHSLFDIGQLRLVQGIPSDVLQVVTGGEPIRELV